MYASLAERRELREMREAVRSSVEALELCWSCQKVSECKARTIDDAPLVPLCPTCLHSIEGKSNLVWPGV